MLGFDVGTFEKCIKTLRTDLGCGPAEDSDDDSPPPRNSSQHSPGRSGPSISAPFALNYLDDEVVHKIDRGGEDQALK